MEQQLREYESPTPAWQIKDYCRLEFNQVGVNDFARSTVEDFIKDSYLRNFGARLSSFQPQLITANNLGLPIHLAFGLSSAANADLFLENYLDQPIESALSRATNTQVQRSEVAELGNLALSNGSHLDQEFLNIAQYCLELGYKYVVCTVTRLLRIAIYKSGVKPIYLGNAKHEDAPKNGTYWGNYYHFSPQIIAGNLHTSLRQLTSRSYSHVF